ncbi:hypothetical protein FA95DRAFT_1450074, partial [Auriscalpium vulgare]
RPQHTSILTGLGWMRELMAGHPESFYDAFGMTKPVFRQLVHELQLYGGLRSTRWLSALERLGIFLYTARTGL